MSDTDKSSSFRKTLESILRPQSRSTLSTQSTSTPVAVATITLSSPADDNSNKSTTPDPDHLTELLKKLEISHDVKTRLDCFDEIVKLCDYLTLDENMISFVLKSTNDLYRVDTSSYETRSSSFETLIKLFKRKSEKFDSLMIKNHLLCIIANTSPSLSKCKFVQIMNSVIPQPTSDMGLKSKTAQSDLQLRFDLFNLVVENGTSCKGLDPELTTECLALFMEDIDTSIHYNKEMFLLFKNLITQKQFNYLDDKLMFLLTRYVLHFSFLITNSVVPSGAVVDTTSTMRKLTQQQHQDIDWCVDLVDKLVDQLTTTTCINHIVLSLCELLDITSQNSRLSNSNSSDPIIARIYECMNKLFVSPIGNCALFTFFSEIFPPNNRYQIHRAHQLNGALMHIKELFSAFKKNTLKNTFLIKELHLNCLIYLPNALKSCSDKMPKHHKQLVFENILNLSIDLVILATNRDLFMCLLTFNSRKFLIEIINQFSAQILDNQSLIRLYAELLNMLDAKEVFSYKESTASSMAYAAPNQMLLTPNASYSSLSSLTTTMSSSSAHLASSLIRNPSSSNLNRESVDDTSYMFIKFKESFYELVYRFPYTSYLKEHCINNCIDYYLQKKLLCKYGAQAVEGIGHLLDKYFLIKNNQNIIVRKFVIDSLHKKLKTYYYSDQKSFTEEVIRKVILPRFDVSLNDDDSYYKSSSSPDSLVNLFEMKSFLVAKLIDLNSLCSQEETMIKIVELFEKILSMEKESSVELLMVNANVLLQTSSVPVNTSALNPNNMTNTIPLTQYPTPYLLLTTGNSTSNCLNYVYKIITSGLIELFERNFSLTTRNMSRCLIKVYNVLVAYLEGYYLSQYKMSVISPLQDNSDFIVSSEELQRLCQVNPLLLSPAQIQAQLNAKYFNYYATLRRDIFEFLMRIRSDTRNKALMVSKTNKRSCHESKSLLLGLKEDSEERSTNSSVEIDLSKLLKLIEYCLDKEIDWNVLIKVLADLPYVLQYEMNLIKKSNSAQKLFMLFCKKDIQLFKNKPDNLTKSDYANKFYPLMASLILYHPILDKNSQDNLLRNFSESICSNKNRYCLETLTIAFSEMHETNSNQCSEILLKLSRFSSQQSIAQPILEFLSTISDLRKIDTIFGPKEFIAVLAIAIKYTDPVKFNAYIVFLAHYVICIWFIKCKPEFRRNYASFTCRGLYQTILSIDEGGKSTQKDSKSPIKTETSDSGAEKKYQRSLTYDGSTKSDNKQSGSENVMDQTTSKNRIQLSEGLKQFYKDLIEITIDFMTNNMLFDSSTNSQLASSNNKNEFLIDIYSNPPAGINANLNSLFDQKDAKGLGAKNTGQTRLWIMGSKIIQITTGLFSNICHEEPPVLPLMSNSSSSQLRTTTASSTNSTCIPMASRTQSNKITQAIDIPSGSSCSNQSAVTSTITNESVASSSSSLSISNNNSYSSTSLQSNYQQMGSNTQQQQQQQVAEEKRPDQTSVELNSKSEELFDNDMSVKELDQIKDGVEMRSGGNVMISNDVMNRRSRIIKRRYKSGLPLTYDRGEDDLSEESSYLRQYGEATTTAASKSKDDSAITNDISLTPPLCCINTTIHHHHHHKCAHTKHHHHHHHHKHTNNKKPDNQTASDDLLRSKVELFYRSQQNNQAQSVKELCHPSCWCNNLVEIICRYPTKVVKYVSLIENNACTSHILNRSIFENSIKLNLLMQNYDETGRDILMAAEEKEEDSEDVFEKMPPLVKTDLRKAPTLSRISESSILQDTSGQNDQENKENKKSILKTKSPNGSASTPPNSTNTTSNSRKGSTIVRKTSFDLSPMAGDENLAEMSESERQLSQSTANYTRAPVLQPSASLGQQQQQSSSSENVNATSSTMVPVADPPATSLDPSQVFLQLFQAKSSPQEVKEQPILIPDNNENIKRSLGILDFMPCYLVHKIGVIYLGRGQQASENEKSILGNSYGSSRYKSFINGLGNLIYLKDLDTRKFYSGGMETDGSVADFTLLWYDGVVQCLFHVATMMFSKEDNLVNKKRHIGNDSAIIVYNESGEEYQFGMLKGEVNCICIEIIPLKSNTNIIKVKTNSEMSQSGWFFYQDPKFVSDHNLALIVRKMALHADICSKIYRTQKENASNTTSQTVSMFGDKWYERLKQINRIKNMSKDWLAKQKQQQQQQQQQQKVLNSVANASLFSNPSATGATATASTLISPSGQESSQLDFTTYV